MLKRIRVLLFTFGIILLLIAQNSQMVKVRVAFWSFEVTALLLMLFVLAIGFMLGYGFGYWWQFRHQHDQGKL